jgi:hypothetical protein
VTEAIDPRIRVVVKPYASARRSGSSRSAL